MDQQLKERLVGAAVLVVLTAIFVPMVLDGPEQPVAEVPPTVAPVPVDASTFAFDLNAPLPGAPATAAPADAPTTKADAAPAVGAGAAPTAAAAGASKPAPSVAPAPKAAAKAPTPTPAPTPSSAAAKDQGWASQVGSFSSEKTAQTIAADLKQRGFKAFVMVHKDGGKTYYRVRVGPVATREAADALGRKITQQTGQAARPVRHP